MWRLILLAPLVACWSSSSPAPPPLDPTLPPPSVQPPTTELRAIVRIDAAPSGKKFQGVWLELDGTTRYVIDYRARTLWQGFADAEVVVTGHCYQPHGQAIMAPHFEVTRLRFASAPSLSVPLFEIGPKQVLRGELIEHAHPAGTRRAGTVTWQFRADGTTYEVANPDDLRHGAGQVVVRARVLEPNRAHAATGGEPLWIVSVHDGEPEPEPAVPCP